ncbi:MAG: LD-carboxypeptidase [Bacteroidales bacterium]|nr:LD-carboxypeptidase [Bacteroidales bacterium]
MHKQLSVLKEGDKIIIVAPAGKVNKDELEYGIEVLKSWGLVVELGQNIFGDDTYFSASDERRLSDFQQALDNENYKAIFCARGGYGSIRIIEKLNWENFIKKPKWILGYSDITLILNKIQYLGFPCIHSPMPASFSKYKNNNSLKYLHQLLFNGSYQFNFIPQNLVHKENWKSTKGIITGGNLTLLQTTVGTPYRLSTKNKILFIEEIDEYPYKVNRMLYHLYHSGYFDSLKGIIIGNFNLQNQDNKFPYTVFETLTSFSINGLEFILDNFPSGHDFLNYPIVMGREITILNQGNQVVAKITLQDNNNS